MSVICRNSRFPDSSSGAVDVLVGVVVVVVAVDACVVVFTRDTATVSKILIPLNFKVFC